jgi:hypothetical protein
MAGTFSLGKFCILPREKKRKEREREKKYGFSLGRNERILVIGIQ